MPSVGKVLIVTGWWALFEYSPMNPRSNPTLTVVVAACDTLGNSIETSRKKPERQPIIFIKMRLVCSGPGCQDKNQSSLSWSVRNAVHLTIRMLCFKRQILTHHRRCDANAFSWSCFCVVFEGTRIVSLDYFKIANYCIGILLELFKFSTFIVCFSSLIPI